jgi:hypothetical protein
VFRLELVVVELEEAKNLIGKVGIPQMRLALILLDSAVELMLFRLAEYALQPEWLDFTTLTRKEDAVARGKGSARLAAEIEELRPLVTSKTRRKKIDRDFNVKVDFLVEKDRLPATLRPVLKKMHAYRNETYHRDEHRVQVLQTAVLIYFDVACTVLEHYEVGAMISDGSVPPGLARFTTAAPGLRDPYQVPGLAAQILRSDVGLELPAVAAFLSEHLLGRLDDLEYSVAYVEENLTGPDVRPGDGYLVLQIAEGDLQAIFNAGVMRTRGYPLSAASVAGWKSRAAAVAQMGDRDAMFTAFAEIEDEFQDLERAAATAVYEIDFRANLH